AITNARLHAEAADRARRLAVSAERERVVRDVHDAVARALGSILMHIDAFDTPTELPAASAEHLAAARTTACEALAETRKPVLGLGPALVDPHALDDALAMELGWARSPTGIRTDLVVTGEPRPLPSELGQQALRIVQEALTNVVMHAKATLVRVGVLY